MHSLHRDRLVRSLGASGSRRWLLAALAALPAVRLPAAHGKGRARANTPKPQVRLLIENLTTAPIDLEGWIKPDNDPDLTDGRCKKTKLETITPPNTAVYNPNDDTAAAWLDQSYLVAAWAPRNDFPVVEVGHGGAFGKTCFTGTMDVRRELGVGQRVEQTIGPVRIEVLRENDIGHDRVFRARIRPATS